MDSAGFGSREASKQKHHLSLALKNEDTFITRLLQVQKGPSLLQQERKNLIRFHYVEKPLNSFLLAVLNDASVERWANIRDKKGK